MTFNPHSFKHMEMRFLKQFPQRYVDGYFISLFRSENHVVKSRCKSHYSWDLKENLIVKNEEEAIKCRCSHIRFRRV